jgi:hypothetical protein
MCRVKIILLFFVLFIHKTINAQGQNEEINQSKINFLEVALGIAKPIKGFKERYGKTLYGFDMSYLRQINAEKPMFISFKFGYTPIGSFSVSDGDLFTDRTSSHLIALDLGARYYLPLKLELIEFFGEVNIGVNNLYTIQSITEDGESTFTNKLLGDSSIKYGTHLGVSIKSGHGYFLVKYGYENGIAAEYMKKINDPINSGVIDSRDAFRKTKSSLDIIKWDIGYTFVF